MITTRTNFLLMAIFLWTTFGNVLSYSQTTGTQGQPAAGAPSTPGNPTTPPGTASQAQVDAVSSRMDSLEADLKKQNAESDFSLQIGIGSLVRNGNITDYNNNANTLTSTALGWATPQYLVGVSLRTPFPNFGHSGVNCRADALPPSSSAAANAVAQGKATNEEVNGSPAVPPQTPALRSSAKSGPAAFPDAPRAFSPSEKKPGTQSTDGNGATVRSPTVCPIWKQRPWGGFISLKFSSSASQTLNGYVLGGSYSVTPYLNVLMGFALTPVNVPSPGLRTAAANYVTQQQALGNDLNFNPAAMRNNQQNAFDGFSLLDSNGKLIYSGTPLEIDYRGGLVVGVAIPLSFADFLQKGK